MFWKGTSGSMPVVRQCWVVKTCLQHVASVASGCGIPCIVRGSEITWTSGVSGWKRLLQRSNWSGATTRFLTDRSGESRFISSLCIEETLRSLDARYCIEKRSGLKEPPEAAGGWAKPICGGKLGLGRVGDLLFSICGKFETKKPYRLNWSSVWKACQKVGIGKDLMRPFWHR